MAFRVSEKGIIAASVNACAYSAAVVADAQASAIRARQSVQHSADTRERVKEQRESRTSVLSPLRHTPIPF